MNTPDFSYITQYKPGDINMIATSMLIGIVLAALAMMYHQLFLGGIVRKLIEKKALTPEEALSIEDLGYSANNILIKFALRDKSTFAKTVHRELIGGTKKYYIPEDIYLREEIKFRKKGTDIFSFLITLLVFLVVAYLSLTIVPWFADKIKNLF